MARQGTLRYGTVWYCTVPYGTVRYGSVPITLWNPIFRSRAQGTISRNFLYQDPTWNIINLYLSSQIIPLIGENYWCEGKNISCNYFYYWNIVLYFLFFSRVLAVIRKYSLMFILDIIYLNDLKDFLFN